MRRLLRLCVGNKEHYVVMTPSPCRYLFFYKDHFLQVHTAPWSMCRAYVRTHARGRYRRKCCMCSRRKHDGQLSPYNIVYMDVVRGMPDLSREIQWCAVCT